MKNSLDKCQVLDVVLYDSMYHFEFFTRVTIDFENMEAPDFDALMQEHEARMAEHARIMERMKTEHTRVMEEHSRRMAELEEELRQNLQRNEPRDLPTFDQYPFPEQESEL